MLIQMSDNLVSLVVIPTEVCSMTTTIVTKASSAKVPIDGVVSYA
jgi:hypothetical protein